MERVPKGQEPGEECLFFPVVTDRPARRRPAALEPPVSPVPQAGIVPAGMEPGPSVPRPVDTLYTARAVYRPRASQPVTVSLSQLQFAEPVCLQITPRSACVLTRRSTIMIPQGTRVTVFFCHPAAADASALRALRRGSAPGPPRPALRVLPGCALLLQPAQSPASCGVALCRPCTGRALFSLCGCCRYPMSAGAGPAVFPDTRWSYSC
jgi:hypothetical protein